MTLSRLISINLIIITSTLTSCKLANVEHKENIEAVLNTHIKALALSYDSTLTIDSVRVLRLDTVSTKDFILININKLDDSILKLSEIAKIKLELFNIDKSTLMSLASTSKDKAYVNSLGDQLISDLEKIKHTDLIIKSLFTQVDSLERLVESGQFDSLDFLYLKPIYKLCFSNKLLEQTCNEGDDILITKDFRVKKY